MIGLTPNQRRIVLEVYRQKLTRQAAAEAAGTDIIAVQQECIKTPKFRKQMRELDDYALEMQYIQARDLLHQNNTDPNLKLSPARVNSCFIM